MAEFDKLDHAEESCFLPEREAMRATTEHVLSWPTTAL